MTPPFCLPGEVHAWQRIRRYAVPRWMIRQATERRAAGDWRGACAAAGVDVAFDLGDIAARYGAQAAAAIEDDLVNLVPDLLRWHLPRVQCGRTTIRPGETVLLSDLVGGAPRATAGEPRPVSPAGPWLHIAPLERADGPQRLTLAFGPVDLRQNHQDWTGMRHLWDARRTGELLERCGGSTRAPFFHADGTPLTVEELPSGSSSDQARNTEWVTLLRERGEIEAACAAAGIKLDFTPPEEKCWYSSTVTEVLAVTPLAMTRLAEEMRLAGHGTVFIPYDGCYRLRVETGHDGARVRLVNTVREKTAECLPVLAEARWRRLPDLDLLRTGRMDPDALHPLVHAAFFPAAPVPSQGPPEAAEPAPFRVRCRGEWHLVGPGPSIPHDEAECRRERALGAFGGAVAGCVAAKDAWTSGTGRLPKALREQRRELFLRAQHGDTPGVLRLLDAGFDTRVRDGGRRTLLHVLHLLDHEPLLPRLLAAGLDLEATDHHERTPLHVAVGDGGSEALVRALLDAGARVDVVDYGGRSLRNMIHDYRRTDLAFLAEMVTPGIGRPDREKKDG
ncbi:hypothetical protein FHS43_002112 [Streptosporangium becharense]|uniref:Ankyrin repeat domain-containing protein n=1 Tax=Streptosporangium becharense TaxID=1816182 RepID=A0A7W9MEP2_9ACTN|nr:ankyrin repeat domain-containing protein [Streptosporangium becharense]MBB2910849.1 hypothetical protein [Streptosporangium becharense]MBB5817544.1 hypothetical protein [Streptosporangium becharense]